MPTTPSITISTVASNFLRSIIQHDLNAHTYVTRTWSGKPDLVTTNNLTVQDTYPVRLRFPPEPNGYLHIGHAKSICLNFGLARDFGGVCHLRFDDTNPEKESIEFENSIIDAVNWLGFSYGTHLYYASDYFSAMHACAVYLIEQNLAYVDEQTAEDIRINRGDFTTPGTNSPYRNRTIAENLARFADMTAGKLADGAAILRAKIDMASANINLRDPAIYRIRHINHHRHKQIGDWCVYPMYTFAHPIEDALENITHSICTLEFEDQRPFYDWLLNHLAIGGLINTPPPRQYEFARLNLTYVVTSKRKLAQLVNERYVNGWDDPRLPTLVGLRRRGYTPEALHLFCERIGITKADSWIDYSTLEGALRDTLDPIAARAMAVLNPIKLIITNFAKDTVEPCSAPVHPHDESRGRRDFEFSHELWIEADDFQIAPIKGYHRLYPPINGISGGRVRLKYGFVIECTGFEQDDSGNITVVYAQYFADSKSGSITSGNYKVKGVIGWVSNHDALSAQINLYDRLFNEAQPGVNSKHFLQDLNPHSLTRVSGYVEPSLKNITAGSHFQFERLGYFVTDCVEHTTDTLVFNRAVSLKDSWKSV
ncbi:MAG: hypothetical protein RL344_690 [Pseudomonadota bacterium]|jgi:glutaminyl-tRNA synthetase